MQPMRTLPEEEEVLAWRKNVGFICIELTEDGLRNTWNGAPVEMEDFRGWWPLPPEPK